MIDKGRLMMGNGFAELIVCFNQLSEQPVN